MKNFLLILGLVYLMTGCWDPPMTVAISYRPVYASSTDTLIGLEEPKPAGELSRVYYKDGYIFFVETGAGIHVFDYTNSQSPKNIGFIKVAGCQEVEMKNATLYTRQFNDLLAIDLSNINDLKVKRFNAIFDEEDLLPPTGYFECPNPQKGIVIAWEVEESFNEYDCYR